MRGGGGRGRRGGGRFNSAPRDNRGGGGGRGDAEPTVFNICVFHVGSGSCRNGDQCRFQHDLVGKALNFSAHATSVRALSVMKTDGLTSLVTGSTDGTVKAWDLASGSNTATLQTTGPVQHLEVMDQNTMMWAVDEPLQDGNPTVPVGSVYLKNLLETTAIRVQRSAEMPYTHPMEVTKFATAVVANVVYLVTGGGEGIIRVWRYDTAARAFAAIATMEGHIRAVTCLLMNEAFLWSGSVDTTIKVWDMNSGQVLATLAMVEGRSEGHLDAVSCMELIPITAPHTEAYVASGGLDKQIKLWKAAGGAYVQSWTQKAPITAMKTFVDSFDQRSLVIGLVDGSIILRSCSYMNILFIIESNIASNSQGIRAIATNLGHSCFASATEDGKVTVWTVGRALIDDNSVNNR